MHSSNSLEIRHCARGISKIQEYQKFVLVFQVNLKKGQEPLLRLPNMLLIQSYHGKPPRRNGFWGYCPGSLVWWTLNNSKPPVPKEKNIFMWLPLLKLFC